MEEDLFGLLMSEIAARRQDPPGPPYFQVKRHPEDDLFLEQICKDEVPWWFQQQNTFSEEDVNSFVKDQVIYTLDHFTSSCLMEWRCFLKFLNPPETTDFTSALSKQLRNTSTFFITRNTGSGS